MPAPPINSTTGLSAASTDTKNAVAAAISATFATYGTIAAGSTTVALSLIESAIAAVPLTTGFVVTTPSGNITSAAGSRDWMSSVSAWMPSSSPCRVPRWSSLVS